MSDSTLEERVKSNYEQPRCSALHVFVLCSLPALNGKCCVFIVAFSEMGDKKNGMLPSKRSAILTLNATTISLRKPVVFPDTREMQNTLCASVATQI